MTRSLLKRLSRTLFRPIMPRKGFIRRSRKIIGLLVYTLIVFLLLLLGRRLFSVSNIRVNGTARLQGLEVAYGRFMPTLLAQDFEEELFRRNPTLSVVSVLKEYPNTLIINTETEQPLSVIAVEKGFLTLAKNGRILAKSRDETYSLPALHYYQTFSFSQYGVGDILDTTDIQDALFFLDRAGAIGLSVSQVDIAGFDMIILNLTDGKQVFFTTQKDRQIQVHELETIIDRLNLEARNYQSIDLRFAKPVIKR